MTLPSIRRTMLRAGAAAAATGLAATLTVAAGSGTAFADELLNATYPVTGSTYLAAPNATLDLGPGKLVSVVDLTTGAITANLKLPPATGSFNEAGLVPVTATTKFINDGPTTGTINLSTGAVQTTSNITLQITSLIVAGINTPVGSDCETSSPVSVTVNSQPGFNAIKGGTLEGSYTIPDFANCGLATLLINLTLPGSGNTISLTLGHAKIKS
jgi:hypothetical protein